jgi:hypothetical protein
MRTVDPALARVFLGSFQLSVFIDVWRGPDQLAEQVPVVDGSISYDIDADVQGTITCTIADPVGDLRPAAETSPLAPYGQELHVAMAADGGRISLDPVGVGWFRIQQAVGVDYWRQSGSTWRYGGGQIEVTGQDRMAYLADYALLTPSQPPASATALSEITRLIEDLVPIGETSATIADAAVSRSTIYEGDRIPALQGLARAIGGTLTVNADGAVEVREPTQYGAPPVWTFTPGDGGDLLAYSTTMTRDGVINAVTAHGDTDGDHAPVQGIAYDTDPRSPTRWGGPFGKVPLEYASPLIVTTAQATAAARTRLNNYRRGRERELTVTGPPNFLLELDDPVNVALPDRTIPGRIVGIELPLTPGVATYRVRALDSAFTATEA